MKISFSYNRNQLVYMLGALVLAGIVLVYLFMYLPANEDYLNERRFRALQRMKNNVDTKLSNSFQLMDPLVAKYDPGNGQVSEYFKNQFGEGKRFRFDSAWQTIEAEAVGKLLLRPDDFVANSARVQDGRIKFTTTKHTAVDKIRRITTNLVMSSDAAQFVRPLVPTDAFTQFVVIADGSIIYETFPSGLQSSIFDSLVMVNRVIGGASTRTLDLAGTSYQAFIQPFNLGKASRHSLLIGLLEKRQYLYERNQLPETSVIALIIGASILLILLPWFKIFGMGERDKLRLIDAVLAFLVCLLLVSGIFMVFAASSNRYHREKASQSLENLALSIEQHAVDHLAIAKRQLHAADILMQCLAVPKKDAASLASFLLYQGSGQVQQNAQGNRKPRNDSFLLFRHDIYGWPGGTIKAGDCMVGSSIDPWFDSLGIYLNFLLDSTGKEKFRISNNQPTGSFMNYARRQYYLRQKAGIEPYSIAPVISWTVGSFRTILSKRSHANPKEVACVSFKLQPLEDALLPAGFEFAVMDADGQVLYHSKPDRNLNEHLPSETTDEQQIMAMIHQHSSGQLVTRYHGKRYDMLIKPFHLQAGYAPMTIAVMEEKQYEALRQTGAFSLAVGLMLALTLFNALLIVGLIVVSSRATKFSYLRIETSWVWPRQDLQAVYNWSTVYNITLLVLLLLLYPYMALKTFIYVTVLSSMASFLMTLLWFARCYKTSGKEEFRNYKMRSLRLLSILFTSTLLLASVQVIGDDAQFKMLMLFIALTLFIGWLFFRFGKFRSDATAGSKNSKERSGNGIWLFCFSVMMLSRLILMSGIPVTYVYKYGYDLVEKQEAAYRHHQYGLQRAAWAHKVRDRKVASERVPVFYKDNYWIADDFSKIDIDKASIKNEVPGNNKQSKVGRYFTPFDRYLLQLFNAYRTSLYQEVMAISDETDEFSIKTNPKVMLARNGWFRLRSEQQMPGDKKMVINSSRLGLDYPGFNRLDKIMHWFLFAMMLGILLFYINRLLNRIFLRNLPGDLVSTNKLHELAAFNPTNDRPVHRQRFTMLNAYLLEEELKSALEALPEKRFANVQLLDLINMPRFISYGSGDLLVFYHAETVVHNYQAFCRLNEELKKLLMSQMELDIVVMSTIPADALVIELKANHGGHSDFATQLSLFTTLLREGQYETLAIAASDEPKYDQVLWERSHVNQLQYRAVWDSLSAEEKYLLHDMAEDGLVNGKDIYHLSLLLQKGLLVRSQSNGQPQVFSHSFRVFILSNMNDNDVVQLKQSIRGKGTWTHLRTPLVMMTFAVLTILFVTQQQAFSSIIGYFTAIAGVVPAITVIIGLLRAGKSGSSHE